jgi:hypothetical protein
MNTRFIQSKNDFPLSVTLGGAFPSWELSRASRALRFLPSEEDYALTGGKYRLLYKGRERSHRFTILDGSRFEYDVILKKEPVSNVVSIRMEGAEHFCFYRQPSFVPDASLKGSIAVYRKDRLTGAGTGKLCHIHRPKIIDALGRSVWGDLGIAGDYLTITIPERWLAKVKYPVVVDPVVGTATIGSQYRWYDEDNEGWFRLQIYEECGILNAFTLAEDLTGLCAAYFYTYYDDSDAGVFPVLYDTDVQDFPVHKLSVNESLCPMRVNASNPAGWRSATFSVSETVPRGSKVLFGAATHWFFYPRFDWGGACLRTGYDGDFPDAEMSYDDYAVEGVDDFLISMYFDYSRALMYIRRLYSGVELSERSVRPLAYSKKISDTLCPACAHKTAFSFFRHIADALTLYNIITSVKSVFIRLSENVRAASSVKLTFTLLKCIIRESVHVSADFTKRLAAIRRIINGVSAFAFTGRGRLFELIIFDGIRIKDSFARNVMCLRVVTTVSSIRDYIISRFLAAKDSLKLKSRIRTMLNLKSAVK